MAISWSLVSSPKSHSARLSSSDDYEDEEDALVSLVSAMASQAGNLNQYQVAALKRIMSDLWQLHGKKMNVDIIADAP